MATPDGEGQYQAGLIGAQLLAGRTAIVTGANSGIGLCIASTFLDQGASVVGCDVRLDSPQVERLVRTTMPDGKHRFVPVVTNVSVASEVSAAVETTIESFGTLDILVNCAGIIRTHPVVDFPLSDWQEVFAVNAQGTFLFSQAVARQMIQLKSRGVIVNIGSAASQKADSEHAAYAASKAAVLAFSRVLALELGPYGIRVNTILPGATETPMLKAVTEEVKGLRDSLTAKTVLGSIGNVQDQANAALFLASDLASHVTGEYLVVAGGEFMNP